MKQVLLDLQSGDIRVEEVPVPVIKKGVIVENRSSLISAGTESSLIALAEKSLIGKARDRPDLTRKVLERLSTDGLVSTYRQSMGRLSRPEPLGYSSAGIVTESNVGDFVVGDRVACAGAGYASHADYVYVPKNLCVKLPDAVTFEEGCFTTVGSIAMQGVRNAKVSVGERVAVIGLGLIGLLTVQILKAAGCRVFGIDIDPAKIALAGELGADIASDYDKLSEKMKTFSHFGADAVIITAGTQSNAPVELAGDLVRDHGRVVALGMTGMDLPRDKYYEKEAEFVVSRSYGPGRYDRAYEEKGIDYPIYVRWTERRNMEAFLDLLAEKKITVDPLITHRMAIGDATAAYDLIRKRSEPYIGLVLQYSPDGSNTASGVIPVRPEIFRKEGVSATTTLGCIGAGVHAQSALYPQLKGLPVSLRGIATATGLSAKSVAQQYGFEYCTTDYRRIFEDPAVDGVVIATRNDLHAKLTVEALQAGKNVFVEKPLATSPAELQGVVDAWKQSGGRVQVGYNRRYSPLSAELKAFFAGRSSPMVIHYRVNAGQIPDDHWANDEEQGGGMLVSECCHFLDYIQFLTGEEPAEVYARAIDPAGKISRLANLQIVLSLSGGSVGTVTYTTLGDRSYSKEQVEVFCDHSVGRITDFREMTLVRNGKAKSTKRRFGQEKGFKEELEAFLRGDGDPFPSCAASMLATFAAWESLEKGVPCSVHTAALFERAYPEGPAEREQEVIAGIPVSM
jgi:predicted dehydrogenase